MRQKTIQVKGQKIVIKARAITRQRNLQGYQVNINNKNYRIFDTVHIQEAMDKAYVKYVKESGQNDI